MKLFKELKRRHVYKAAISYLVAAWLILQICSIVFPILEIDPVFQRWILIALIIGFPAWIVFAYLYDWTPQGFRKTSELDSEHQTPPHTLKRTNHYIIAGLSLALILMVADKVFNLTTDLNTKLPKVLTIAVLPFSNQGTEETDDFFASGVHEDVMAKLAGVKDFRIISRASVMPYKDFEGNLKELGARLNAKYILQGTVRRWNDQIRMTVQLVDTHTDLAVWSNEYNGELKNVFELQASIATTLSEKLEANLSKGEQQELEAVPTQVLAAYDDFLKARHILNQPRTTYDEVKEAITLLDQAVEADKKFAKAWTLLVQAHSELYNKIANLEGRETEMAEAKKAAETALQKAKKLAPNDWQVLSEEGTYLFYIKQDPIAAMSVFEKALEQNPSDVSAMSTLGRIYFTFGDVDKSIAIMERAFELVQTNGLISYSLSFGYEMRGEYSKMVPLLERLYELYPEDKHYWVESKYYQFLADGTIQSFNEFKASAKNSEAKNPWDERALKNMEMVVAMFDNEFEAYQEDWQGKFDDHLKIHGDWMCPLVANDHINQARLLFEHDDPAKGEVVLEQVGNVVLKPVNPNSVCVFNPQVYIPKLDYLSGNTEVATEKIEGIAMNILQNKSFPTGAVERSVLLEAMDLIQPSKVYHYYELVVKNSISMTSFESICADPWTYPNLIKDPRFIAEVKEDGRFVQFLTAHGFLKA